MNSVSSIKKNNAESPKTPGGIRKALLTPCRRVGLSRKWKKSGSSPFISPLSGVKSSYEVKEENILRKRKKRLADETEATENNTTEDTNTENSTNECDTAEDNAVSCNTPKIAQYRTPSRNLLSRKKSKIHLTPEECNDQIGVNEPQRIIDLNHKGESICKQENLQQDLLQNDSKVSKLSRKNSKNKIVISPTKVEKNLQVLDSVNYTQLEIADSEAQLNDKERVEGKCPKEKSPNNLTKECMVVIQKKIFKTVLSKVDISESNETKKIPSQTLFDSEEDDVPLSSLNPNVKLKGSKTLKEKENIQNSKEIVALNLNIIRDEDFVAKNKNTVKMLENKTTSTSGLKIKRKEINKPEKSSKKAPIVQTSKPISQSSNSFDDDDDDFEVDKRKNILIKRLYDKVTRPLKAKSTGSITQKDIDEIKARIETKKNLLLAREMSNETKELRDLIKKWQTGCQTALTELLELMKKKMPEQKMEYSELLQMLKIPPDLVGYDSENDCFNTPDETKIILSVL